MKTQKKHAEDCSPQWFRSGVFAEPGFFSGSKSIFSNDYLHPDSSGCGSIKRDEWITARMDELLSAAYYHIVFILPHELNPVIMGNRSNLFDLLFQAASQTLLRHAQIPEYLGAEPGITMVLHTLGQDLSLLPMYTVSSVQVALTGSVG